VENENDMSVECVVYECVGWGCAVGGVLWADQCASAV
jgi:hypothetical protein